MHICMIASTPLPPQEGIGFYVWNLSSQLTRLGHSVYIITRGKAQRTSHETVDGIQVWRPPFVPAYPLHVHIHGLWVDRLVRDLECSVDLFHLHTPLVRRPRTRRPMLVTVHTPMKADAAAVSTDTLLGWLIKLQAPVSYRLEQDLFDQTNKLTAVSSSVAAELQAYGTDPERVRVLGNGVNTDLFFPQPDNGFGEGCDERPYALTVARLAPRKGLSDLIECAAYVAQRIPQFRFLIAGDGPMKKELQDDIARRGLADRVILLGHVRDRAQLIELYRHATIFVHPAHYEGLPTVLLEAMACGCPAVTTAVSGALDVIQHEQNGILVPPHSPEQMGAAILEIVRQPDFARRLSTAARKTIEERYSWRTVCHNYIAEYQELVSEVQH